MAKTGGTGSNSSNSNSKLNSTNWTDDPRAIMQVGQNLKASRGQAAPSSYKGGNEQQTQRVQQHLTQKQAPQPRPLSERPSGPGLVPGGAVTARPVGNDPDYLDMIFDQAFGSNGMPAPGAGVFPPRPHDRPSWKDNPAQSSGDDEQAVQDAIDRGISVEQIAAGAIGGGATALIAKSILDQMRGKNVGDMPINLGPNGDGKGPRPTGNILDRNGLQSGVPTMNEDINRQFQELFGMPMPTNKSNIPYADFSETGGNEPRLIPGPGKQFEPYEAYERPLTNKSNVPGPNQPVKQLGDMDSPNYRPDFGYAQMDAEASRIAKQMQMYDVYDIEQFMDPSANPALARAVQNLLRSSF